MTQAQERRIMRNKDRRVSLERRKLSRVKAQGQISKWQWIMSTLGLLGSSIYLVYEVTK